MQKEVGEGSFNHSTSSTAVPEEGCLETANSKEYPLNNGWIPWLKKVDQNNVHCDQ